MTSKMTFIGFGEAAMAFATPGARGYDLKLDDPATRTAKRADFAAHGAQACNDAAEALAGARVIFSLVTADQAYPAARDNAAQLEPAALWLDMNSVAPDTKRAAAMAIEPHADYVDVAVICVSRGHMPSAAPGRWRKQASAISASSTAASARPARSR